MINLILILNYNNIVFNMSSLDEDKLKECKIIFEMFDSDKDTKITTNELGDCLRVCGAAPSQQDLEMIINEFEENGKKFISFEEFLTTFESLLQNQDTEEDIINEFKKLDKLNNGTISEADLRQLMGNYQNALSPEEIEDIIQEANVDENGYINIEKFTKILLGNI